MRADAQYLDASHRAKAANVRKLRRMLRTIAYGLVREEVIVRTSRRDFDDADLRRRLETLRTVLMQAGFPRLSDRDMRRLLARVRDA